MLNSVLTCLFESLSTMLRKNVEKRHLYDNLDLVMLTLDEICDDGFVEKKPDLVIRTIYLLYRIILESDPLLITQRVQLRQDDIPLGEQTVSQVSDWLIFDRMTDFEQIDHELSSLLLSIRYSIRDSICSSMLPIDSACNIKKNFPFISL